MKNIVKSLVNEYLHSERGAGGEQGYTEETARALGPNQ